MAEEKKTEPMEPSIITIIMMLSGSAIGYLKAAADKEKQDKKKENLQLARFTIDLLAVLEEKTKGNLEEEEKKTLENVLADLRLQYIKATG
ncbi:MAG: DUF1844 domain-containing protein [Deltaproteobacteria bacterium]|nr:MAG: DUF1844 domain-containing protein [Deltaproteobacteria bacterium]